MKKVEDTDCETNHTNKLEEVLEHLGVGYRVMEEQPYQPSVIKDERFKNVFGFYPYTHQKQSVDLLGKGRDVVLVAGTGSGKSEVYMLHALSMVGMKKRSIVLYPTKALARDQAERFKKHLSIYGVSCGVLDGDVSHAAKEKIKHHPPHIIITNPEMLHHMCLHHVEYRKIFKTLGFVVLDEMHTYSGTFGSHTANILKRAERLVNKHGGNLQFFCATATIKNPRTAARLLTGRRCEVVLGEGKVGKKLHVLVNPFSHVFETALTIADGLNMKTLIFVNSHRSVEQMVRTAQRMGIDVWGYRAGIPISKRREIEEAFKQASKGIVVSTSALELGMDVGNVDVVILCGFPGSMNQVKQRIGRAGRRGQTHYAIFIATNNPIDQYYFNNPDAYVNSTIESCYLDPDNPEIKAQHQLCMASEIPLNENEYLTCCKKARENMVKFKSRYLPSPSGYGIIQKMNLRGIGAQVTIKTMNGSIIGKRDEKQALFELYPHAIYFSGGRCYVVKTLTKEEAIVEPTSHTNMATKPIATTSCDILFGEKERPLEASTLSIGRVLITTAIMGYEQFNVFRKSDKTRVYYDEPLEKSYETNAVWLDLKIEDQDVSRAWVEKGLNGFINMFQNFIPAVCGANRGEVEGLIDPGGRVVFYETKKGVGIAKILFERYEEIVKMVLRRVEECECINGCPRCVISNKNNKECDKSAARYIASLLAGKKDGDEE